MNTATAERLLSSLREALRDDRPAVAAQVAALLERYLERHSRRIGPVLRALLDGCRRMPADAGRCCETPPPATVPMRPPADLDWHPDGRTAQQTADGQYRVERLSRTCYLASRGLTGLGAYPTADQARAVCRRDASATP
jgi:hypothetical protein